MRYINWNIKCYCNIDKIIDFLLSQADEKQCIIALQEVMPEKAERIRYRMSDRYSISYSMDYRKAGDFDTDNRRLGVMIIVSKDMDIIDTDESGAC